MPAFPPLNYNGFFFALAKLTCAENYTQFQCKVKQFEEEYMECDA
jgi:hypothetical protein